MNPKYKKKVGGRKAKPAVSKNLRKAITTVMAANVEDKMVIFKYPPTSGFSLSMIRPTVSNWGTNESGFVPLIPAIAKGTNSNQRIGDRITPKGLNLALLVTANGTFPSSFDLWLRVMLVTDRGVGSYSVANSTSPSVIHDTNLLELGGGLSKAYTGDTHDNQLKINKNQFITHYDKVIHFQKSTGIGTYNNSLPAGTTTCATPKSAWTANIKVPLPKYLKYEDTGVGSYDNYPTNAAPLLCIGYAECSGVFPPVDVWAPGSPTSSVLGYQATATLRFEDA